MLPPGCENRARMTLCEKDCAPYNDWSRGDGSPPRPYRGGELRTPVFLLHRDKLQRRESRCLGI